CLNPNPLHLVQIHVVVSPVEEARRAGRLMRRYLLRNLQFPAVLKVRGNARRPKRVVPNLSLNPRAFRAAPAHPVGVGLAQGQGGEPTGLPRNRAEQQSLGVVLQARNLYICLYILVEVVMGRDFMLLASFLIEPHPTTPSLDKIIFHFHCCFRARSAPCDADPSLNWYQCCRAGYGLRPP